LGFLTDAATPEDESPATVAAQPVRAGAGRPKVQEQFKARRAALQAGRKAGAREMKPLDAWAEYAHALLLANEASFVN
jgi:hypothetical protein